jgi:hypothetical protein
MVECNLELTHFLRHIKKKLTIGPQSFIKALDKSHMFVSNDLLGQLRSRIEVGMGKGWGKVWDLRGGLQWALNKDKDNAVDPRNQEVKLFDPWKQEEKLFNLRSQEGKSFGPQNQGKALSSDTKEWATMDTTGTRWMADEHRMGWDRTKRPEHDQELPEAKVKIKKGNPDVAQSHDDQELLKAVNQ